MAVVESVHEVIERRGVVFLRSLVESLVPSKHEPNVDAVESLGLFVNDFLFPQTSVFNLLLVNVGDGAGFVTSLLSLH